MPIIEKITKERDAYLKRGLELARTPLQSAEVDQVYAAFLEAQKSFPSVQKNAKGYNYNYATLDDILYEILPLLHEQGLAFVQYMDTSDVLHTRIQHSSGQFFESQCKFPMPPHDGNDKKDWMQVIGTRRTYLKRYEAVALLGLSLDKDTDGI